MGATPLDMTIPDPTETRYNCASLLGTMWPARRGPLLPGARLDRAMVEGVRAAFHSVTYTDFNLGPTMARNLFDTFITGGAHHHIAAPASSPDVERDFCAALAALLSAGGWVTLDSGDLDRGSILLGMAQDLACAAEDWELLARILTRQANLLRRRSLIPEAVHTSELALTVAKRWTSSPHVISTAYAVSARCTAMLGPAAPRGTVEYACDAAREHLNAASFDIPPWWMRDWHTAEEIFGEVARAMRDAGMTTHPYLWTYTYKGVTPHDIYTARQVRNRSTLGVYYVLREDFEAAATQGTAAANLLANTSSVGAREAVQDLLNLLETPRIRRVPGVKEFAYAAKAAGVHQVSEYEREAAARTVTLDDLRRMHRTLRSRDPES